MEQNVLYFTDQHNFLEEFSWPTNFVTKVNGRPILLHSTMNSRGYIDKGFLLGSSISWFHFLIEILPRFLMFGQSDLSQSYVIVRGEQPQSIKAILELLGFKGIIEMTDGQNVFVGELHVVTDLRFRDPFSIIDRANDLNAVREYLLSMRSLENTPEYVYIERPRNLFRSMRNGSEFRDSLCKLGFIPLRPELMTLGEQISIFANASIVVAESGAAMTNALLMQAGSTLIEISPEYNNQVWVRLANQFNINHFMISSERKKIASRFTSRDSYSINLPKALQQIEKLLKN
jgi:capsular polysaccharide biosynthesis protein